MRKRANRTRKRHSLFALSRLEIWGCFHDVVRSRTSDNCRNTREGLGWSGHKVRGKVSGRLGETKVNVIFLCRHQLLTLRRSLSLSTAKCAYLIRLPLGAVINLLSL